MPPSFSGTQCLNFPTAAIAAITRGVIPLFDQRTQFDVKILISVDEEFTSIYCALVFCYQRSIAQIPRIKQVLCHKWNFTSGTLKAKRFCTGVYRHEFPLFTCPGTVLFLVTPLVGLVLGYVLLSRSSRVESVTSGFDSFKTNFRKYLMASYTSTLYREYSSNVLSSL